MRKQKALLVSLFTVLALVPWLVGSAEASVSSAAVLEMPTQVKPTADHGDFDILYQEFKTGPEVTKACLTCHNEAASQVHKSIHWTWEGKKGEQKELGKSQVINNF